MALLLLAASPMAFVAPFVVPSPPLAAARAHPRMIIDKFLEPEPLVDSLATSADLYNTAPSDGGLVDALIFFVALSALMHLMPKDIEQPKEDDAPTPEGTTGGFGWLHADLRTPLPSMEDLRETCHLVGSKDGRHMWLCATNEQDDELEGCSTSTDFSRYYGQPVYVCAGDEAEFKLF